MDVREGTSSFAHWYFSILGAFWALFLIVFFFKITSILKFLCKCSDPEPNEIIGVLLKENDELTEMSLPLSKFKAFNDELGDE